MIDAKKVAREEFTACSEVAKEESIASMSLHYGICMSDADVVAAKMKLPFRTG